MKARHQNRPPPLRSNDQARSESVTPEHQPSRKVGQQTRSQDAGWNPDNISRSADQNQNAGRIKSLLNETQQRAGVKQLQRSQQKVRSRQPQAETAYPVPAATSGCQRE